MRRLRPTLLACGLVVVGYALAVAPWTIRNQLAYNLATPSTFGRTMIARTASYDRGFVFVDPSRPESDPTMARAAQIVQQGADRGDSDGTIAQRLRQELDLDPIEVNALMRDLALGAIARQPLYFVEGSLRFALRIFNGIEVRLRDHEAERRDVVWDERTRRLLGCAALRRRCQGGVAASAGLAAGAVGADATGAVRTRAAGVARGREPRWPAGRHDDSLPDRRERRVERPPGAIPLPGGPGDLGADGRRCRDPRGGGTGSRMAQARAS